MICKHCGNECVELKGYHKVFKHYTCTMDFCKVQGVIRVKWNN